MLPEETRVQAEIGKVGPLAAFRKLIAENDGLIRGPQLDNGQAIVAARSAIYTEVVREWAAAQQKAFGYDKPFGRVLRTSADVIDFARTT